MDSNKNFNEKKNIKNYNQYLRIFFIINFSIYICILVGKAVSIDNINIFYKGLTLKDGVVVAASTIITFVLNGIFPSTLKYILVFWRLKNPLPSYRVFSKFIDKDNRIDKSVIIKRYGTLPTEPNEQSKLWYKIYKPNEFDPMIFDSQRNFLLARDLTTISFLILIIFPIGLVVSGIKVTSVLIYAIALIGEYIILAITAQNYGKRFACNALAIGSVKN